MSKNQQHAEAANRVEEPSSSNSIGSHPVDQAPNEVEKLRAMMVEADKRSHGESLGKQERHPQQNHKLAETNRASQDIALPGKEKATKAAKVLPIISRSVPKPEIQELKKEIEQLSEPEDIRAILSCSQKKAFDILGYVPRVEEYKISYHQKRVRGRFYWYASWKEGGEKREQYVGLELPSDIDQSQTQISYHPDNPIRPHSSQRRSKTRTR